MSSPKRPTGTPGRKATTHDGDFFTPTAPPPVQNPGTVTPQPVRPQPQGQPAPIIPPTKTFSNG